MFGYYLRIALRSCARDPGFTALIVFAIALGIGVCVTTLTVYRAMSSNPIWWKNDRLYAVTMDSWAPDRPENSERPSLPPPQLTYTDATYLFFNSTSAERKVLMYPVAGVITNAREGRPLKVFSRVTSADFFPAFEVPFRYGSGWNAHADVAAEPVVVLSQDLNERLFGGANSVGRTIRWNSQEFRIIGVLAQWQPLPRFYDLNSGSFNEPEALYVPWGWGRALQLRSSGAARCWKAESIDTYDQLIGSECTWLQMWVELDGSDARERMQTLMDTYWAEQRKSGRFPRARNNRLLVGLAFAFLGVCLVNTIGLLLAKFLAGAPVAGVRRALGASRIQIFNQHLVQAAVLALTGSLLGLASSSLLLGAVRALYSGDPQAGSGGYQALAHFDSLGIVWAIVLALVAVLTAGAYPAWRIGRVSPARYLKSQ
jgi:putative ABC transport system permease protein